MRQADIPLDKLLVSVLYATDSEFDSDGLAELWQTASPFMNASSASRRSADFNPSDEDFRTWADYLREFASLPAQREMVESATDYELMRARRLVRFAVGCFRRFDHSVNCRDDSESLGGQFLIVFDQLHLYTRHRNCGGGDREATGAR